MVVMVEGKQQKCGGGGGCEEKQSKCGGSGGGGGGKTIEMWCWRENNRNVEVMVVMKGKQQKCTCIMRIQSILINTDTKGTEPITSVRFTEVSVLKGQAMYDIFGISGTKRTVRNREVSVLQRCLYREV